MKSGKKARAVELIEEFRDMDPAALNALIVDEVGEDLSGFFLAYARKLLAANPSPMNASALMLMGYLIRANEEKLSAPKGFRN